MSDSVTQCEDFIDSGYRRSSIYDLWCESSSDESLSGAGLESAVDGLALAMSKQIKRMINFWPPQAHPFRHVNR